MQGLAEMSSHDVNKLPQRPSSCQSQTRAQELCTIENERHSSMALPDTLTASAQVHSQLGKADTALPPLPFPTNFAQVSSGIDSPRAEAISLPKLIQRPTTFEQLDDFGFRFATNSGPKLNLDRPVPTRTPAMAFAAGHDAHNMAESSRNKVQTGEFFSSAVIEVTSSLLADLNITSAVECGVLPSIENSIESNSSSTAEVVHIKGKGRKRRAGQ